jgi:acetyl-CoA acetyltransferase
VVAVVVRGVGVVPFGRQLSRSLRSLAEEAALGALSDAGLAAHDIDVVFFANSLAGLTTGQEAIRGQTALRGSGLLGKPIFNVENACASGSSAFVLARSGLLAGLWRRALVVGAEKMFHADKSVPYRALAAAADLSEANNGPASGAAKSIFMELYAEQIRHYMERSGATRDDFAGVVVKNRRHAAANPIAQFRSTVTTSQVLESGEVAWPLTRFMCSPISDGAAALVLTAGGDGATAPLVEVRSSQLLSSDLEPGSDDVATVARRAFEEAAIGPEDVDVVELHDAAAPAELEHSESLGLCPSGGGPELFRSGATGAGGRIPINPGGGLVGRGHPVGATGVAQLAEIALQLRGTANGRQVEGARVGLVQNAGGAIAGRSAASSVHILVRS